jgi:micrococcal nuclease
MRPSRARVALLLGLALVAVVVGRGLYELALGLHVLGGAGVDQAVSDRERDRDRGGPASAPPPGVPTPAQRALVDRVVDGDTIRVRVEDAGAIPPTPSVRVRLLNIDAPELDHPSRGRDCGATEATDAVERLVPSGSVVWLVPDVADRDAHDRPLRGVFTADGAFVNAEVVRRGWAEVVLFEPNDRFHEGLRGLEAEARRAARGAWGACGGFP